jgi:hypothetical protein
VGYDWPCNPGCKFNERHVGHCSTLDAEEQMAVDIIKASATAKDGVCPFCKTQFSSAQPKFHPVTCTIHSAMTKFWAALPYIIK